MAANGELPLLAVASKPGGSDSTRSPWLIQTFSSGGPLSVSLSPPSNPESPGSISA
jgi:hypothetical protein